MLLGHELLNNLPNVRVIGLSSDRLKALLNVPVVSHLLIHTFLEERSPSTIDKELVSLLNLI